MEGAEVFEGILPLPGHRFVTCDGCGPRTIDGALCMGTGVTLWDNNLQPIESWSFKHYSPFSTNILAEFLAIRDALQICISMPPLEMLVDARWCLWSDNEYAVKSFNGVYPVNVPHLVVIKNEWMELKEELRWMVELNWLPSKNNWAADIASRKVTEFLSEGT